MWCKSLHSDRIKCFTEECGQSMIDRGQYRKMSDGEVEEYCKWNDLVSNDQYKYVFRFDNLKLLYNKNQGFFGYGSLFENILEQFELANCLLVAKTNKNRPKLSIISVLELNKHNQPHTNLNIVKTDWEADSLPKNIVEEFNKFDVILIGRDFFKPIFEKSGVVKPILVQPDGINSQYFVKIKRTKNKTFTFLNYNAGEWRKNTINLVKCFAQEFKEGEAKLILKNSTIKDSRYEYQINDLIEKNPQLKTNLELVEGRYSIPEMIELSKQADCFIFPSRGEGYGLPVLEMMAVGLPVIAPEGHAFYHIPNDCYLPIKNGDMVAGFKAYKDTWLWQPSNDSIQKQMRFAFENPDKIKKIAKKGQDFVWETEHPKDVAKKWLENFDKIFAKT